MESHPGSGTILVERAQYGSTPRSFTSKHSYIAVRASEESSKSSTGTVRLWFYNFSARAPVDGRGLAAANVLSNELGERFAPGGRLSLLDGIAFDVFRSELGPLQRALISMAMVGPIRSKMPRKRIRWEYIDSPSCYATHSAQPS